MSELVHLPNQIAQCVNQAVTNFASRHTLKVILQYQGADLWQIAKDELSKSGKPVIVTRRVTIVAYSDDEDKLNFMPDILTTSSIGRYVPSPAKRVANQRSLSLFELQRVFFRSKTIENAQKSVTRTVLKELELAWKTAETLSEGDATQLVP